MTFCWGIKVYKFIATLETMTANKLVNFLGHKLLQILKYLQNVCHWPDLSASVSAVIAIFNQVISSKMLRTEPGNTKGGSFTVRLTSCLTGLESDA